MILPLRPGRKVGSLLCLLGFHERPKRIQARWDGHGVYFCQPCVRCGRFLEVRGDYRNPDISHLPREVSLVRDGRKVGE